MERMRVDSHQERSLRREVFHRRYRRGMVSGFSCDIADGNRLVGGIVGDVSSNGFKLLDVDESFQADDHCYQTVVSGKGRHYKMLAKPCWRRKSDKGLEVGFKIMDVSWEWTEFILDTLQ